LKTDPFPPFGPIELDELPNLAQYRHYFPLVPARFTFPDRNPFACKRDCKKFYEHHNKVLSFALYGSSTKDPRVVCAYAASCGTEFAGIKFQLKDGETTESLLRKIVPDLIKLFVEEAMMQASEPDAEFDS